MADLISGDVSMEEIAEHVKSVNVYPTSIHSFVDAPPGPLTVLDMPLSDYPAGGQLKCIVDVVMNVPDFPKAQIQQALVGKSINDIPAPYGLKKSVDNSTKFDLAVVPQTDGKFCVVKIVNFKEKAKASDLKEYVFGTPHVVDWAGEVKTRKKCLHYAFENIGGFQCRNHVFRTHDEGKPENDRTEEEWDAGFDFIEQHGPRENVRNKGLRWVTIQISKGNSPIYKWPSLLVEKSLRNLAQDGVLANVHEIWPLTLYDLDVRILRALAPLIPTLNEKALGFHGTPGSGKTPVARTVAMALSRHNIRAANKVGSVTPSFRQASEFDFFRGQTGTLFRPDIFDDGSLAEQPFKKVKAFTDVGNIESMSKERPLDLNTGLARISLFSPPKHFSTIISAKIRIISLFRPSKHFSTIISAKTNTVNHKARLARISLCSPPKHFSTIISAKMTPSITKS